MSFTPDFKVAHVGINIGSAEGAEGCAAAFEDLFSIPAAGGNASACYSGTAVEWMKHPGRGLHGHLAISTGDLAGAVAYLEKRGLTFDPGTAKYNPDGRMRIIYAAEEIGGFAIHLLQR